MERHNKLLLNIDQHCTAEEQAQGRANLGLSAVASTGNYSDLSDTPVIPPSPVQSDWDENDSNSLAYIQNRPTISSITTTTAGLSEQVVTGVRTLDINLDTNTLKADTSPVGFLAPYVQPTEKRILTMQANGICPEWDIGILWYPVVYQDPNVTYANVVSAIQQGYAPVLVDSNGRFIANYKYYSSSIVIFQGFTAQPMHMTEYWLKSDNTWENYQRDIFDTTIEEVYTNDRVGSNFQQVTLPNMDFVISSYMDSGTGWQKQDGTAISGSMFDEFKTKKPELVRYDYSSDLCYVLDSAPAGTPTAVFTVRLEMFYRATQNDPYTTVTQYWAPTVTIPFSNFVETPVSGGTAFFSCEKPLNYSVTFDRQRFESLVDSVDDLGFQLVGTISNITPPGTYHNLRQVAASSKWVFQDHV